MIGIKCWAGLLECKILGWNVGIQHDWNKMLGQDDWIQYGSYKMLRFSMAMIKHWTGMLGYSRLGIKSGVGMLRGSTVELLS